MMMNKILYIFISVSLLSGCALFQGNHPIGEVVDLKDPEISAIEKFDQIEVPPPLDLTPYSDINLIPIIHGQNAYVAMTYADYMKLIALFTNIQNYIIIGNGVINAQRNFVNESLDRQEVDQ